VTAATFVSPVVPGGLFDGVRRLPDARPKPVRVADTCGSACECGRRRTTFYLDEASEAWLASLVDDAMGHWKALPTLPGMSTLVLSRRLRQAPGSGRRGQSTSRCAGRPRPMRSTAETHWSNAHSSRSLPLPGLRATSQPDAALTSTSSARSIARRATGGSRRSPSCHTARRAYRARSSSSTLGSPSNASSTSSGKGASKSWAIHTVPLPSPGRRLRAGRNGTSLARGLAALAMMISWPDAASSTSAERWVLAS
jgi:hypothetical protein